MTAKEQMRDMLDQLMGTSRNGEPSSINFHDTNVCRNFLLDCCPHDILAATRVNIGKCPKIHELALRVDFEIASRSRSYNYDVQALEKLQEFIDDYDRRKEVAKKQLADTQEELVAEAADMANGVHAIAAEIGKKLATAEALGESGQFEKSMQLMEEIEELRCQKIKAEHEYNSSISTSSYQQQKLRVCEVCAAYLGIHDNDDRLADHFGGKMHQKLLEIREKLASLKETVRLRYYDREVHYRRERSQSYRGSYSRDRFRDRRFRDNNH